MSRTESYYLSCLRELLCVCVCEDIIDCIFELRLLRYLSW